MTLYTPFHLDAVRPLPSISAALGQERVARIILLASEYRAFGLQDALSVLVRQRRIGDAFEAPQVICLTEPQDVPLNDTKGAHDLWLLHTAMIDWDDANVLARTIRERDPRAHIVVLSDDRRAEFNLWRMNAQVDGVYVWQGQPAGLLALLWLTQDRFNVEKEMAAGLPLLLLVEDKPVHYSSFIPRIYHEIIDRIRAIIGEAAPPELLERHLRMRPRVLLAETFEQAIRYLSRYHENLIGIISDLQFPAGRELHPRAGLVLTQTARCLRPTVPIIVQSTNPAVREEVLAVRAHFLYKRSDRWLREVRRFMLESFGFGDFIFRDAEEREIARASTIRELYEAIQSVSDESFLFHARRHHFSTWLYIHGAHELARRLRPLSGETAQLRQIALDAIDGYLSHGD